MVIRNLNTSCWNCGYKHDSATGVDATGTTEDRPSPGDCTICIHCGEWNIFTRIMKLRKPRPDEFYEIGLAPMCRAVRAAWVASKK